MLSGHDAVLFDCDGVLVDSEPYSEQAWRRALSDWGIALGDFTVWVGKTDSELAAHFSEQAGADPEVLAAGSRRHLLAALRREPLTPHADALAVLASAEESGLPTAVVTNSERWRLRAILASAGLGRRFAAEVTSEDVAAPKPAPDVYLAAAERLGVAPGRCLALEDSPVGVAAARAAGMTVVAVDRGMFAPVSLAGADLVTEDATALLRPGARF